MIAAGWHAIASAAETGDRLPDSPHDGGGWFLYRSPLRSVLYHWVDGRWVPIVGFGDIAVAVDEETGDDESGRGEDDAPFKSKQRAILEAPAFVVDALDPPRVVP